MAIRLTTYEHSRDIPSIGGTKVFNRVELFEALEHCSGMRPYMLVATDGKRVLGTMVCVVRRWIPLLRLNAVSIYGTGEYFPSRYPKEQVFREMLSYFTTMFADKASLLEFRNIEEPLFGYKYFRENGYFPLKWQRVQNTLQKEEIDRWMSSGRKRQISRGLRRGATMEIAHTESEILEFFSMVRRYYRSKLRRYMPEARFFLELNKQTSGRELSRTFIIRYKGKVIGGSVCLFSGKKAYLIFSCGLRATYALLCPGVLAVWGAMSYSMAHGYDKFEFIDAGLPFQKHNFREFILPFGGRQISSRRWFKVRWGWLNRLLIKFYLL